MEVTPVEHPGREPYRNALRCRKRIARGKPGSTGQGGRRAGRDLKIRRTKDIIDAAEKGLLPDKIMINVHPQRWTNDYFPWVKELVGQNFKNVVKRAMLAYWNTGMITSMLAYWDAGMLG